MHFSNKVVWITGASSGIGRELALQFARKNAILILTSRNLELLENVKIEVQKISNFACHLVPFDLNNSEKLEYLVDEVVNLEGRIDCAIMNAGVSQRSLVKDTEMEVYRRLMEINYFAPVAIIKKLIPILDKQNGGNITVISSVAGLYGFPLRSGYAAAKHAIKGFIETLQCESYNSSIKITIVYPGRINTNISRNALDGRGKKMGLADENNIVGIDVAKCVSQIINAIEKEKKFVMIANAESLLNKVWWYWRSLFYKIAFTKGMKE